MSQTRRICLLLGAIALLACVAALRLQLSYDLAFFLPPANTEAQQILLERVGQGPGAQLTFVVLPQVAPPTSNQATAEIEAASLAAAIRKLPQVQRVLPEMLSLGMEQIPPVLWDNRVLLADLPTNKGQWLEALGTTLDDMMFASDASERAVLAGDPTLASLEALQQFTRLANDQQFSSTEQQVLLVQASAAAFDLDSQTQLVDDLRNLLKQNGVTTAQLYGSGVYGVDLQRSVQREATLYSLIASVALLALLFLYLRSASLVLIAGLPLLAGGMAGLAVLALVFSEVHGITLAFGFTLLGVAVDYPLHLVVHKQVHQQQGVQAAESIWPTLRLGVLSTAIAYLAFALSGSQGLQQLGLFALVGICAAALASAWLCPSDQAAPLQTLNQPTAPTTQAPQQRVQLRHWPWLLALLVTTPILASLPMFSDDLSSLTPVPSETLAADAKLRESLGVTNMRHLIALRGANQELLLQQTEEVTTILQEAVTTGELAAYQSITSLLPSEQRQVARRQSATSEATIDGFNAALAELPFAPDAFSSFRKMLEQQRTSNERLDWQTLTSEPSLHTAVNNLMYSTDDGWVSLVFLAGMQDPAKLQTKIEALEIAQWIDLKAASLTLAADYRSRVLKLLVVAIAGIALLLLTLTRKPQRVLWLLGSGAATLACAMLGSLLLQGLLSLFDLMALTLVAGLGLDYSLFYSKPTTGSEQQTQQQATARAVLLCALSSLLVFGILACSSIPLLRGIGTTVACGVVAAYLLARFGRYAKAPS